MRLMVMVMMMIVSFTSECQTTEEDYYNLYINDDNISVEKILIDNGGYIVTCDQINNNNLNHNYWNDWRVAKELNPEHHVKMMMIKIREQEWLIRKNVKNHFEWFGKILTPEEFRSLSKSKQSTYLSLTDLLIKQSEDRKYYEIHIQELRRCSS